MHIGAAMSKKKLQGDLGTPERALRQGGVMVASRTITDGGISTSVGTQATVECLLDALLLAGKLDGTQGARADRKAVAKSRYQQGIWLRELAVDAGLIPTRAVNLNGSGGGRGEMSEAAADARARWNKAVGFGDGGLKSYGSGTAAVVCFDQVPDTAAKLDLIQRGLDRLCELRGA